MTISNNLELQACFILHTRKYRDTSLLVEVFSREKGRYTLVAKGARSKKNRYANSLQLFIPLLISSFGQGELKTAGNIEINGTPCHLVGRNLMIGLYVNELLYRVMGKFDPFQSVFDRYEILINALQSDSFDISMLRDFELSLLSDLGYGISFEFEAETGEPICKDLQYQFVVEEGFHGMRDNSVSERTIAGEHILNIAAGRLDAVEDRIAKQVVRQSIDYLLDGKTINSRVFFSHQWLRQPVGTGREPSAGREPSTVR